MSRLWSSGPRRQSQFTPDKERHETRARGDDGGRETETGHSGPISYSGGPPLIKCRSTREKEARRSKRKYAIRNCGEERKKGKKKLLFTETDVGRVQTAPHTESQESLIFFHPVRFPTAPGGGGGAKRFEMASSGKCRYGWLAETSQHRNEKKPRASVHAGRNLHGPRIPGSNFRALRGGGFLDSGILRFCAWSGVGGGGVNICSALLVSIACEHIPGRLIRD